MKNLAMTVENGETLWFFFTVCTEIHLCIWKLESHQLGNWPRIKAYIEYNLNYYYQSSSLRDNQREHFPDMSPWGQRSPSIFLAHQREIKGNCINFIFRTNIYANIHVDRKDLFVYSFTYCLCIKIKWFLVCLMRKFWL